jgi:tetratricopeptide (TPR) repeat protein
MKQKLILALCGALVATMIPALADAQIGRIQGQVFDMEGNPLEGVTVTVTAPDLEDFEIVKTTNKKGKFMVTHSDVGRTYLYTLSKEGYQTTRQEIQPAAGGTMMAEFRLPPPKAEQGPSAPTGKNRAIKTYNEGVAAQDMGDLELAAEKYREAAKIDENLAAAYTALSAVHHLQEEYEKAAAAAEQALAIDPNDVRALNLRYDAYRAMGDTEKAKEAEEDLRAVGDLGEVAKRVYNEAVEAYNAGDVATAMSKFLQVVNLDPELVQAYVILGALYLQQDSAAQALSMAKNATAREPGNVQALKIQYDAARKLGDTAAANAALDGLVEVDPEWVASSLFEHAVEMYNNGNLALAEAELESVLEAKPDHARAHYFLGLVQFNQGNSDRAVELLKRFIELAPEDPDVTSAKEMISYAEG